MKRIVIILSGIILLLIILISIINFNQNRSKYKTIYNQIENIQELVTAKQIYREILYSKESKDILWIPVVKKELLFSVEFIVTAGFDLEAGYKVRQKNNIITITLPRAKVMSIDADDTSIKEYFVKERFSSIYRDDYFTMIQKSKERLLKGESINTLLTESENSAKEIITTMLRLSDIEVNVEFYNGITGLLE